MEDNHFNQLIICFAAAAAAKSLQSCPTLCDPIDGSPPGSPVPGILQARTLEWVAIAFSNAWKWKVKVKLLGVRPSVTPWTAAHQAPPPMGFSRQEYWGGVPLPSLIQWQKVTKKHSASKEAWWLSGIFSVNQWSIFSGRQQPHFVPLWGNQYMATNCSWLFVVIPLKTGITEERSAKMNSMCTKLITEAVVFLWRWWFCFSLCDVCAGGREEAEGLGAGGGYK